MTALKHSKLAPHFAVWFEACQVDWFWEAFSFANKRYRRIQEPSQRSWSADTFLNWGWIREMAEQFMGTGASLRYEAPSRLKFLQSISIQINFVIRIQFSFLSHSRRCLTRKNIQAKWRIIIRHYINWNVYQDYCQSLLLLTTFSITFHES